MTPSVPLFRSSWLLVCLGTLLAVACDTVDLGAVPADLNACRPSPTFFVNEVWPKVLDKAYGNVRCSDSRCHDAASGRQLVLTRPSSLPPAGPPLPPEWDALYKSAAEQMQCTNVQGSPLLTRPSGLQTHGGGKLFETDGEEATLLRQWLEATP